MNLPTFSIVINTDGRASTLENTLSSLRHLDYSSFEVCAVVGPTADEAADIVGKFRAFKFGRCEERNLSKSRNIGIAMSTGDIVAFIDDDAVPEPEWLRDLAAEYSDPSVGAVGGFVYDHTGVNFQSGYVTVNRLGYPDTSWTRPASELNFPFTDDFPHLLGTNASFRRSALLAIGGFDEEFEYFLDETDVCCRIIDKGFKVIQSPRAFVHHKYAPSAIRDNNKIVRRWYPLVKNQVYFALKNATRHYDYGRCVKAGLDDIETWGHSMQCGRKVGVYSEDDHQRFLVEVSDGLRDGIARGERPRQLISRETLTRHQLPFRPITPLLDTDRKQTICFVTQDYPPGQNGGIARYISHMAARLGAIGYHVHVITQEKLHDRIDYEDDTWVHRLVPKRHDLPSTSPISPQVIPQHIWNWSMTALDEVQRINSRRRVDLVYAPIWDAEGVAFLRSSFPLVTSLQTTMSHWLQSYEDRKRDPEWMKIFGNPILAMERALISSSWKIHAISHAIARDVEKIFDISIAGRLHVSPIGLSDWRDGASSPAKISSRTVKILFVGRLETRKGIDVLLDVAPRLLASHPNVTLDIVGDDSISMAGTTYRKEFEARDIPQEVRDRVKFHGRCDEELLRRFYKDSDIFVAPSRYESFGLISLEAMMFSKPVVACDVGGIPEVVEHGVTGILVNPADASSLLEALELLVSDRRLRAKYGAAGRKRFEKYFTADLMVTAFMPILEQQAMSARSDREGK